MESGIEAVVLTGGESRRMGRAKADILTDGIPNAERIVAALAGRGLPVTILGPKSYGEAPALGDEQPYQGPLAALSRFKPYQELVFVAACDLVRFDVGVVDFLYSHLAQAQAAIPVLREPTVAPLDSKNKKPRTRIPQPLCALYRAEAFSRIADLISWGKRSMMAWLDVLVWAPVVETAFAAAGIDPRSVLGVNTEEELSKALSSSS